jgi:hypothetical protein
LGDCSDIDRNDARRGANHDARFARFAVGSCSSTQHIQRRHGQWQHDVAIRVA